MEGRRTDRDGRRNKMGKEGGKVGEKEVEGDTHRPIQQMTISPASANNKKKT